jgi:hypothetical protein
VLGDIDNKDAGRRVVCGDLAVHVIGGVIGDRRLLRDRVGKMLLYGERLGAVAERQTGRRGREVLVAIDTRRTLRPGWPSSASVAARDGKVEYRRVRRARIGDGRR